MSLVPVAALIGLVIFAFSEDFLAGVFGVLLYGFMLSPILLVHLLLCAALAGMWCPASGTGGFVGGGCCMTVSTLAVLQFEWVVPIH